MSNFALIAPHEGGRVAQVAQEPFEVAQPLFWVPCAANVVADAYRFEAGAFVEIPPPPVVSSGAASGVLEL